MKQDMQEPSRLYVRNDNGRYTVATADRVVEAARTVAEQRVHGRPRGERRAYARC